MESFFKKLSFFSATTVFILLLGIFISLVSSAYPSMKEYGFDFLIEDQWGAEVSYEVPTSSLTQDQLDQIEMDDEEDLFGDDSDEIDGVQEFENDSGMTEITKTIYGGLVPIVGTVLSTLIAMIFAVPIALGIAVYLSEIAPVMLKGPVGVAIELLAAIPSIIYGMWGLYYFAPIIQSFVGGYQVSLLTAGLVLGIMILPFMAAISRDAMNTTPDVLKESAYAMGATKFEVIKDVIFPYAKVGILGSIILSLGRALGETMAVAFLIGGIYSIAHKVTDPTISIPVALANNFGEADGFGESSLFYLALILFIMSFAIISFAKFYLLRRVK
ncbi:MAG: phosphate ABC transporter permease subunit PstC [Campylobacterota bacterium]|nr:phosphate ABC transporter permease subunit PstC [Campylobacterota bacterium]